MEQAEAALRTAQQNYAAAKAAVDALQAQQTAAAQAVLMGVIVLLLTLLQRRVSRDQTA